MTVVILTCLIVWEIIASKSCSKCKRIRNMPYIIDCTWKNFIVTCPHRIYNDKEIDVFHVINSKVYLLSLQLNYSMLLQIFFSNSKYKGKTNSITLWSHWRTLQSPLIIFRQFRLSQFSLFFLLQMDIYSKNSCHRSYKSKMHTQITLAIAHPVFLF